jgi:hypothetical protein
MEINGTNEDTCELIAPAENTLILTPEEKLCLTNELILTFKDCDEIDRPMYLKHLNEVFKKLTHTNAIDYEEWLERKERQDARLQKL